MSKIDIEVENRVDKLARLLERDGLIDEPRRLNELHSRRLIWDQMALRVSEYLDMLLEKNDLIGDTRNEAIELRNVLKPFTHSIYEERIYTPARQLGVEIEKAGFPGWEQIIAEEIAASFTGGEIFDALRYKLNAFLNTAPNVPGELQRKVRRFLSHLS